MATIDHFAQKCLNKGVLDALRTRFWTLLDSPNVLPGCQIDNGWMTLSSNWRSVRVPCPSWPGGNSPLGGGFLERLAVVAVDGDLGVSLCDQSRRAFPTIKRSTMTWFMSCGPGIVPPVVKGFLRVSGVSSIGTCLILAINPTS